MGKINSNKERLQNFFWRSLQVFGKQGIFFLMFLIFARVLLPHEFGVYNYALSIIFLLIMFADFGVSTATSKFVAECYDNDKDRLKLILPTSVVIITGLSIFIIVISVLINQYFFNGKLNNGKYLLPLVFLVPITSLYDGIFRGVKRFKYLAFTMIISGMLILPVAYILSKKYGIVGAFWAQNIYYSLLMMMLFFGFKEFSLKVDWVVFIEILSYSLLVGIAAIGYFMYTRADIIILGHFGFFEEIGNYEIINRIFNLLLMPVLIAASVVAPENTKKFFSKKYTDIKHSVIVETVILFVLGLIVVSVAYLFLPYLFSIFFYEYNGEVFLKMLKILLILIPFRFFSTYLTVGYITPVGKVKVASFLVLVFGAINVALDYLLIGIYGFIGVVYATVVTQLLYMFLKDLHFFKLFLCIEKKEEYA